MTSRRSWTRGALAGLAAVLAMACAETPVSAPAPEAPARELAIPLDLREQVQKAASIGHQLYLLDKVAAIGTDVLLENVKDLHAAGVRGYLPIQQGDADGKPTNSFLVAFFTADDPPRIAYEVRVPLGGKPTFQQYTPPKAGNSMFAALVRARRMAIKAMPPTSQPYNPVLIPGEANGEHGVLVYLLAGTKKPDIAVFGRHFRALVPLDGTSVSYMMPLSNSALELPLHGPNGEAPEALIVSHVVTDAPLETHVFTSLLIKKIVYVGTRRGVWRVDGDKIAFIRDKPPKSLE